MRTVIISVVIYVLTIVVIVVLIPLFSERLSISFSMSPPNNQVNKVEQETVIPAEEIPHFLEEEITEYQEESKEDIVEKKIDKEKIHTDKPLICIILDDYGYTTNEFILESILFDLKLTLAIIPFTDYSKYISKLSKQYNKEVIIHLPMASKRGKDKEKNIISPKTTKKEIIQIIDKAFSEIPNAIGLNNHKGSLTTKDYETMKTIISYLKEKNKIFVDSYTTVDIVSPKISEEISYPTLKRDVFLDNNLSRFYILDRLDDLAMLASRRGYAVGIGHAKEMTIKTLKEWYIENKDKYNFVTVSELWNMLTSSRNKTSHKIQ